MKASLMPAQSSNRPGLRLGEIDIGAPWTPGRVTCIDLPSDGGGFRALVSVPEAPAPATGYGVVYAMDAGWSFGTLCDLAQLRSIAPSSAGYGPTVIVALGWPGETLVDLDRRGIDLVGEATSGPGRHATLTLLTDTLLPRVEGALPIDPARRMILGHSFGGAFALQARAARPGLFSHVAAGSPSIWTDPEALFAGAATRDRERVLITLGARETPEAALASGEPADRVARLRDRDLAGRARRMAELLDARFHEIPGANHGGAIPAFLAEALDFLWLG